MSVETAFRSLQALFSRVSRLEHMIPSYRWGTVESLDPLAVRMDTDAEPTLGLSTLCHAKVGDRVQVRFWLNRAVITGVAGGSLASGSFLFSTGALTAWGSIYSTTVPLPAQLTDGQPCFFYLHASSAGAWAGRVNGANLAIYSAGPSAVSGTVAWVGSPPASNSNTQASDPSTGAIFMQQTDRRHHR